MYVPRMQNGVQLSTLVFRTLCSMDFTTSTVSRQRGHLNPPIFAIALARTMLSLDALAQSCCRY